MHKNGIETQGKLVGRVKSRRAAGVRVLSLGVAVALAGGLTPKAHAFDIVIDPANLAVNAASLAVNTANLAANGVTAVNTGLMKDKLSQLVRIERDTNGHIAKIDRHAENIDGYTRSIDGHSDNIEKNTLKLLNQMTSYYNTNYAICGGDGTRATTGPGAINWDGGDVNGDFYCTVVNQGQENTAAADATSQALGTTQDLVGQFSDAGGYSNSDINAANADLNGSKAQKTANAALVQTLQDQSQSVVGDADRLSKMYQGSVQAHGQAIQLQYLNALASEQAHQLVQMRSVMLASQQAEVTRNQVVANREAQAIAAGAKLRANVDTSTRGASSQSW